MTVVAFQVCGEMTAFSISGLRAIEYPCVQMKLNASHTLYTKRNSTGPFQVVREGKLIINLYW